MKKFICKHFGHSWGNSNAINVLMIMAAVEIKNNDMNPLTIKCDRCGVERDLKQEIIEQIKKRNKR